MPNLASHHRPKHVRSEQPFVSKQPPSRRMPVVLFALFFLGIGSSLLVAAVEDAPDSFIPRSFIPRQCNPSVVVGDSTCAKCHENELQQWRQTPHYRTFDTLHRTDEAKAIAKRMGLRSIKRNDTCVTCHYTRQQQGTRLRVIAGVSCESCHGGARDWLELHADYGGPSLTRSSETPAHRDQRRQASIAAGMNNPMNLYLIARQCLSCHTVPNEQLVNVGGHRAGSDAFELVAWSQGSLRHNFIPSGGTPHGTTNQASPPERLRIMYVVGILADLEASLRAVSNATTHNRFGQNSASRAARMKQKLWLVQRKLQHPLLAKALAAVSHLELTLGNVESIAQAADQVGQVAFDFSTTDGHQLSAIDSLLPPPSQYK